MKNFFQNNILPISTFVAILFLFQIHTVFGQATPQQVGPLVNGDKVLFVGNSFTEWSGPLPDAILALIKASNSGLQVTFHSKIKGMGIFKEYATWTSMGVLNEIKTGGYKYVVLQGWEDAIMRKDAEVLENGTTNPVNVFGFPACQDTMLKYFRVLDTEIKNAGATTILYQPHVSAPHWLADMATSNNTYAKLRADRSCFYAPLINAWDSVRVKYPATDYGCGSATPGSFIPILFNTGDCSHQYHNGLALDAMTFYTIFTRRTAQTLNPVFPVPMTRPDLYEELAGIGYKVGKSILALNNSGFTDTQKPTIPTNVNASNILTDGFTLNWTSSTDNIGVLGYHIYKDGVLLGTTATSKFLLGGLSSGTTYAIKINAFDSEGNISNFTSSINVTTGTATAIDTTGVLLAWDFTAQEGTSSATASKIMKGVSSASPSGTFTKGPSFVPEIWSTDKYYLNNMTATSLADAIAKNNYLPFYITPLPGNKLSIKSISFDGISQNAPRNFTLMSSVKGFTDGNQHGTSSVDSGLKNYSIPITGVDSISASIEFRLYIWSPQGGRLYEFFGVDNVMISGNIKGLPATYTFPTNLNTTNLSETGFTLNWNAVTNASSYEVFKDGISVGTTTSLFLNISNVVIGSSYTMTVKSKNSSGTYSESSSELIVKIPDTHAPSIPLNLSASNISTESFQLHWNASTDNVGVTVYEITMNGAMYGSTAVNNLPVPFLSPSTTYVMAVRAKDAAGNYSAYSATITVVTLSDGNCTWKFAGNENAKLTFVGTKQIRYGANGAYNYMTATSTIDCNNATFGDPISGVVKTCEICSLVTATESSLINAAVSIFPSPSSGVFNLRIENEATGVFSIHVFNILGADILQNNISKKSSVFETTVDLTNFPAGVYYIELNNGNSTIIKKIIKI